MRVRRLPGSAQWRGEHIYCDARRWLRFDPEKRWTLRVSKRVVGRATPVFRRWMSDGQMVFRLELGARITLEAAAQDLGSNEFARALSSLLLHRVETCGLGETNEIWIADLPNAAFDAYCRATSHHRADLSQVKPWLIARAPVLVYLEYYAWENQSVPAYASPVSLAPELSKVGVPWTANLDVQGSRFQFCLVNKNSAVSQDEQRVQRDVRLNVLRMHAELSGLREALRWATAPGRRRRQIDFSLLMPFLESALVHLRQDRGPLADPPSFRIARSILEHISPGEISNLLADIQTHVRDPSAKLQATLAALHHSPWKPNMKVDPKSGELTYSVRSPWASGSFYLFSVLSIIVCVRLAFGRMEPLLLPIVVVAGILVTLTVGALQLRQDDRLSQKSFLALVGLVIRSLPLIRNVYDARARAKKD